MDMIRKPKGEELEIGASQSLDWSRIYSESDTAFEACGSLDLVGDLTITGDLIVQQSSHIYLRGPITSSRILVNGPITASAIFIKPEGEEGREYVITDSNEVEILRERLDKLERAFIDHINSTQTRLGGNK
jgi:hypothetical protein